MADTDLVAIRIRVTGGKQGAKEFDTVRDAQGRLRDEQGRYVKDSTRQSKEQEERAKQSTRVTSAAFKKQAAMMQNTGRTMTYGLTLPLGLLGAAAIKTAANFDKSMAQVGIATKTSGRALESLRELAIEQGKSTIFSANEAADAMLNLSKAGMTPAQIKGGALAATLNLAAAGGMDLAESGNLVGAAMNTFNLKAGQAAQIADALAGGANASSADVKDLSYSLTQAGQAAKMAELSLSETVGTLAAFADQGLRGSDAGTSLKTFLMRLNPTTKKAKELMAELGLSFFDANGQMVGMSEVSRRLNASLGDMTTQERNAALQILFGSDAIRAANIVYSAGPDVIKRYTRATEERGAAEKMASAQMKGLPGALEELKGSLETAALEMGRAMTPVVIGLAAAIGGLADGFTELPDPMQSTIVGLAALTALAGPVLFLAGSLAKARIAMLELRAAEGVGMMGRGGKWRIGAGIAGLGLGAAGGAMGGKGGELVSNVGGSAAMGFALGGPMGAMVGATGGAVITALPQWEALFSTQKKLGPIQAKLVSSGAELTQHMRRQQVASSGLAAANQRLSRAQSKEGALSDSVAKARRRLNAVVAAYGPASRPAIHAEAMLAQKIGAHTRNLRRLRDAQKMHGVALQAYKVETRFTVLAERHRVNVLSALRDRQSRLFQAANKMGPQSERTRELSGRLLSTENKLAEAQKKHAQTMGEAASKAGPKWAKFLQNASQEALRAGGNMKLLNERMKGILATSERLSEQSFNAPSLPSPDPFPTRPRGKFGASGPKGQRLTPSPATRRLLGAVADPRPSNFAGRFNSQSGRDRFLVTAPIKVGRQQIAEVTVEAIEDDEARL